MRKERRHVRSEGKRGMKRAEEGGSNGAREMKKGRSVGEREIGREGNSNGGTLRRTLASIEYTAVSAQNNTQRGPCHCDFGITGRPYINSVGPL